MKKKEAEIIAALKYGLITEDPETWVNFEVYPEEVKWNWLWRCVDDLRPMASFDKQSKKCIKWCLKHARGKNPSPKCLPFKISFPIGRCLAETAQALFDRDYNLALRKMAETNELREFLHVTKRDDYFLPVLFAIGGIGLILIFLFPTPSIPVKLCCAAMGIHGIWYGVAEGIDRKKPKEQLVSEYFKKYIDWLKEELVKYEQMDH